MEQVMFGKVSLAALAMVPILGATHTGDLRELYNQMYPVNTMTRDAFNLCHESDATFVRALQTDRDHCLDHMPHSIAIAIGRVRPDSDLLAWAPISEGERAALRLAQASTAPTPARRPVAMPRQLAAFIDVRQVTVTPAPLAAAMDLLARPGPSIDDAALARLVLQQSGASGEPGGPPLPLLPISAEPGMSSAAAAGAPGSVGASSGGA
jgi:hypothetical protein